MGNIFIRTILFKRNNRHEKNHIVHSLSLVLSERVVRKYNLMSLAWWCIKLITKSVSFPDTSVFLPETAISNAFLHVNTSASPRLWITLACPSLKVSINKFIRADLFALLRRNSTLFELNFILPLIISTVAAFFPTSLLNWVSPFVEFECEYPSETSQISSLSYSCNMCLKYPLQMSWNVLWCLYDVL